MLIKLLNTLLMLVVALSITGVINRTRAVLAGRKGIRFFQHVYNARLMLRKGAVYSPTTTALFRIAPCVYLGAAIIASACDREENIGLVAKRYCNASEKISPSEYSEYYRTKFENYKIWRKTHP